MTGTRKLPIYQVDAFTDHLFGGNPAAVVILEEWLPEVTMQSIARENNLAETAFVVPEGETFGLRWFTPEVEMDLCGHATLAAAHVLFEKNYAEEQSILFRYQDGMLAVSSEDDILTMDFPSRPPEPTNGDPALTAALGKRPLEVHKSRDLLALFGTQREIEEIQPDMGAIAKLNEFAVIVTAPGEACDFVSRFFAPRVGVPEDPVTGSAHCTLTPFWSGRLGKLEMIARQLSPRGGEVACELLGDRVRLSGKAVMYLEGQIVV